MEYEPDKYGIVLRYLPWHSPGVAVFGVWNPAEHVVHVVASVHSPQPVPHAAIRDNITWLWLSYMYTHKIQEQYKKKYKFLPWHQIWWVH